MSGGRVGPRGRTAKRRALWRNGNSCAARLRRPPALREAGKLRAKLCRARCRRVTQGLPHQAPRCCVAAGLFLTPCP